VKPWFSRTMTASVLPAVSIKFLHDRHLRTRASRSTAIASLNGTRHLWYDNPVIARDAEGLLP